MRKSIEKVNIITIKMFLAIPHQKSNLHMHTYVSLSYQVKLYIFKSYEYYIFIIEVNDLKRDYNEIH